MSMEFHQVNDPADYQPDGRELEPIEQACQHEGRVGRINFSKCVVECRLCGAMLSDLNPLVSPVLRVPRG